MAAAFVTAEPARDRRAGQLAQRELGDQHPPVYSPDRVAVAQSVSNWTMVGDAPPPAIWGPVLVDAKDSYQDGGSDPGENVRSVGRLNLDLDQVSYPSQRYDYI